MIISSAAAALAATLIAGPVAFADPAPPGGASGDDAIPVATTISAPLDTAVYDPRYTSEYGPSGPDGLGMAGTAPAALPVTRPVTRPVTMPVTRPVTSQAMEPKQAVYHTKGKDGVRHDVYVVPISDDPSQPITLPDFGFKTFHVANKPRAHTKQRAHKPKKAQHRTAVRGGGKKKHRHGGKGIHRGR
ncbi:hypothetical protein [Microbispora hainanensis]|uniref:hypothetical protein n=1 Tax=Microbispora hainanensis TaxID=568844 RepID=UPI003251ADBD